MSTATLKWTVPTLRTDGTVLLAAQIDHGDIFDSAADVPATPIGTVRGAVGTFTTGVLTVGVHNFTVTTTDTDGHVSAPSNVASVTVVAVEAPPNAVTDLTATLDVTSPVIIAATIPTSGPAAGGTTVTINGTDLTGATSVTFGALPATNVTIAADGSSLTAMTPPAPPGFTGAVDITIVTPNGKAVLPASFTYV